MSKERRSGTDRRSPADGRRLFVPVSPLFSGRERRKFQERRTQPERRKGWIRVSEWSSKPAAKLEPDKKDKG